MKKVLALCLLFVATWAFAEAEVARHQFTSAIENREPIDELTDAMNVNPIYYFTELKGFEGQTVVHRWSFNGNVMAEVSFNVGGPRWRVYSSKLFQPEWDGQWQVDVVDANGAVVASDSIAIQLD